MMPPQHTPVAEPYPENPTPMRFTPRDGNILETIHAFDGLMGDYQIKRLFFSGERQTRERLRVLWQNGYLARIHARRRPALPCMVYWLGEAGAEYVAGLAGESLGEFYWRQQPREKQIEHDLKVNDFRLDVVEACERQERLKLDDWISGHAFTGDFDTVHFSLLNGRKTKQNMLPDGYIEILMRMSVNDFRRFRFLLEIDMANHPNPRFVSHKVLPTLAYIKSEAYLKRFGHNTGRMLVVTTPRRLANLKRNTEHAVGGDAGLFYFTSFDRVKPETVLTAPIWYQGGQEEPQAIFTW